jgi:hypothetical protein
LTALLEIGHDFQDISVTEGETKVSLLSMGTISEGAVSLVEFTSSCENFRQVSWRKNVSLSREHTQSLRKRSSGGTNGFISLYMEPSSINMVVLQVVNGNPESIAVFDHNGVAKVENLPDYLLDELNISRAFISTDTMDFFSAQNIGTTTKMPTETVFSQEKLSSDSPESVSVIIYASVAAALTVMLALLVLMWILRWKRLKKRFEDQEKSTPITSGQSKGTNVSTFTKRFSVTQKITLNSKKLKLKVKLDSGGFGEVMVLSNL